LAVVAVVVVMAVVVVALAAIMSKAVAARESSLETPCVFARHVKSKRSKLDAVAERQDV